MNIGALLAGILSGFIGGMGLGGGAVIIIYLTVFKDTEQLTAQGINLLFFVPIALTALLIYAFKKQIKWKTVLPFMLCGLLGAAIGFWLSDIIPVDYLSKVFGGFLIVAGLLGIFKKKKSD